MWLAPSVDAVARPDKWKYRVVFARFDNNLANIFVQKLSQVFPAMHPFHDVASCGKSEFCNFWQVKVSCAYCAHKCMCCVRTCMDKSNTLVLCQINMVPLQHQGLQQGKV